MLRRLWHIIPQRLRYALWRVIDGTYVFVAILYLSQLARARTRVKLSWDKIAIVGFHSSVIGLGEGARLHADSLEAAGLDVERIDVGPVLIPGEQRRGYAMPRASAQTVISHINPPELLYLLSRIGPSIFKDKYHIGYWAWELPEPPKRWKDAVIFVDEIWCPSSFTADALRKIAPDGFPIRVVPHPVHLTQTGAYDRQAFQLAEDKVVVLSTYDLRSSLARKNVDGLLKLAERAKVACGDDVLFVHKVVGLAQEAEAFNDIKQRLNAASNIRVITDLLPATAMLDLIASSDIILSLHRSEGYGLLIAQGMQAGKPTIATGWSGNTDFMTPEANAIIGYSLVSVVDKQGRYKGTHWAEPDLDQALVALERLAQSAEARATMGALAKTALSDVQGGADWAKVTLYTGKKFH